MKKNNMPHNNSNFWAEVIAWLNTNAPAITGSLLAIFIAAARSYQSGESKVSSLINGCICGGLCLGLIPLLEYFGLSSNLATFAGGVVGFIGVKGLERVFNRVFTIFLGKQK